MGFQHQKIYKIESVADGNVLDLHGANTSVDTKIQTWANNNSGAQRWLANQESDGFRLASVLNQQYALRVIDQRMDNGILYYNNNHGYLNQQFYADGIGNGKFLIKNTFDFKAIKNQGVGVQVKAVFANPNDVSQQWRIIPM